MMNRTLSATAFFMLICGCAQVTPSHKIPVKSEYIKAGIQIGDTVEITTTDAEEKTFEVVNVTSTALEGPEGEIPIIDIQSIVKRSWTLPVHPCGNNEPVGCSIPETLLLIDKYSEQTNKFHSACVTHDFCYRHGYATYGVAREQCDADFLADMKKSCGGLGGLGLLDLENYSTCHVSAKQTHDAVRRKGEPYFRTSSSTYCEYQPEL